MACDENVRTYVGMADEESILAVRIRARLVQLGITPSEAVRRAGLSKDFIYDIYNGKKASPRSTNLEALAKALECDPDYLTGRSSIIQSAPRYTYTGQSTDFIQQYGFVGAGMWTEGSLNDFSISSHRRAYFPSDRRFSIISQFDLEVQGTSANLIALPGQVARAVYTYAWPWPLRGGDLVIATRTQGELTERSIRRLRPFAGADYSDIGFTLEFETSDPRWTSQSAPRITRLGEALDEAESVQVEAVVIYVYGLGSVGEDRDT